MDWRVFLTTFGVIFLAEMGEDSTGGNDNGRANKTALGGFHRRCVGADGGLGDWRSCRKCYWDYVRLSG